MNIFEITGKGIESLFEIADMVVSLHREGKISQTTVNYMIQTSSAYSISNQVLTLAQSGVIRDTNHLIYKHLQGKLREIRDGFPEYAPVTDEFEIKLIDPESAITRTLEAKGERQ